MSIKEKYEAVKSNVCGWMDEHPKAALGIKIGAGVAVAGAAAFGCYKLMDAVLQAGYDEGVAFAIDKLTPHDCICRLQFQYPIENLGKELWPACMQHLKDDGINSIFTQDGKDIVALFGEVKESDVKNILEGFIEAGGDPDKLAVMFEAPLRA